MKSILATVLLLVLLVTGCATSSIGKPPIPIHTTIAVPTQQPIQAPELPLGPYYLYSSDTTLIFLDFADGKDERASTTSQIDLSGHPCLTTDTKLRSD